MPLNAVREITIPAGATGLSAGIEVGGGVLMAIQIPSNWVTADMTFQGSADGVIYNDLYQDNGDGTKTETKIAAAVSTFISALDPTIFAPLNYIKLRSGTTGTPVNQTTTPTVKLIFI